jgi:GntR family transcriptional regulator
MQTIKKIGTKKTIPQQVYAYLLQMIKAGQFKTGDKFPSEPELASRLGVSRLSLREALSRLEADEVIFRVHGVGTFVRGSSQAQSSGFEKLSSLSSNIVALGKKPGISKTVMVQEEADELLSEKLDVMLGEKIILIKRLRTVDDTPLCWNLDYIPEKYLPQDFEEEDISLSIYTFLETNCNIFISHSNATIYPALCDTTLSKLLCVPEGTLLHKIKQTHFSSENVPIIYSIQWFLNSSFEISISRTR